LTYEHYQRQKTSGFPGLIRSFFPAGDDWQQNLPSRKNKEQQAGIGIDGGGT